MWGKILYFWRMCYLICFLKSQYPLMDCFEFRACLAGRCLCSQNLNEYSNKPAKGIILRRSGYFFKYTYLQISLYHFINVGHNFYTMTDEEDKYHVEWYFCQDHFSSAQITCVSGYDSTSACHGRSIAVLAIQLVPIKSKSGPLMHIRWRVITTNISWNEWRNTV